jgi:hypothetical protein
MKIQACFGYDAEKEILTRVTLKPVNSPLRNQQSNSFKKAVAQASGTDYGNHGDAVYGLF